MRELVFNNLTLKVFSVLLAALIWTAIYSGLYRQWSPLDSVRTPRTAELRLPVLVLAAASNQAQVKVTPAEVTVQVSGDVAAVHSSATNEIRVYIDLTDGRRLAGRFRVEVDLPDNLRVERIQPPEVVIEPMAGRRPAAP
jgi:YbbR domain-containing protein